MQGEIFISAWFMYSQRVLLFCSFSLLALIQDFKNSLEGYMLLKSKETLPASCAEHAN